MLLLMGLAEGAVLARLVQFLLGWCSSCSVGALETSAPPKCATVRVRCPIGFRSPPDRFPSAVRSDSVRRPIRFRSQSVEKCWEKRCKNVVLNANTIGDFAIFDVIVFRCFYYPHPNNLCISVKSVGEYSAVNSVSSAYSVGKNSAVYSVSSAYSVGEYSAVNSVSSAYSVGKNSAVNSVHSAYSVGEYSVINSVSSAYSVGDHSAKPSMKSCFFVQFHRLLEKNAI